MPCRETMLEMIFWKLFQFFKITHAPRSKLVHNTYLFPTTAR